jgi:hypothetical protein
MTTTPSTTHPIARNILISCANTANQIKHPTLNTGPVLTFHAGMIAGQRPPSVSSQISGGAPKRNGAMLVPRPAVTSSSLPFSRTKPQR